MKTKGRIGKFVAKALTVLTAFSLFNCREPQVDKLPKNPAKEICATTSLCVSGITELPNGSFNSRIDPEKIDQDSDGNWISSNMTLDYLFVTVPEIVAIEIFSLFSIVYLITKIPLNK